MEEKKKKNHTYSGVNDQFEVKHIESHSEGKGWDPRGIKEKREKKTLTSTISQYSLKIKTSLSLEW